MLWDKQAASKYDNWEQSEKGSFALKQESRLLLSLIYDWRRRNQSMLEIGCGTGYFLDMFWGAGFDVTGVDKSAEMLQIARARLGGRAELKLGRAEHLDFEDNEFDYVAMLTVLEFAKDPFQAVKEACRVSKKGIIVAFLNKCSIYYLSKKGSSKIKKEGGTLGQASWMSCMEVKRLLRQCASFSQMETGSVLLGPQFSWRFKTPGNRLNTLLSPVHFGAYSAVKGNFCREKLNTPLIAWKAEVKTT